MAARLLTAHNEESASHTVGDTINDQSLTGSTDLTDIDSRQVEIETLAQKLRDSPNKVGLGLNTLAQQTQQRVLLVVDQLEELFTLCPDQDERIKFIEAISNAGDESGDPIRVVCTIRDDFLGHLARAGESARRLLEHIMLLDPPNKDALKDVLTLPLMRVGYRFDDPDLPDEMVNAVDDATSLPLLQFVARSLWEKRDQVHHTLRRVDYESMGGVDSGSPCRWRSSWTRPRSNEDSTIAFTQIGDARRNTARLFGSAIIGWVACWYARRLRTVDQVSTLVHETQ